MRASRRAQERIVTGAFFSLLFVVYTCVFPYNAGVNNPNENVRTFMTMAIVHEHTFHIDGIIARYGWVNDMVAVDEPTGEKLHYSGKAPAISYAGVPVYWLMTKVAPLFGYPVPTPASSFDDHRTWLRGTTAVLRLFVVQLPCFAFLVALERWLRRISGDLSLRLTAVAAAGLGTNYLAYSLMYASHAPFAASAFTSFAIITTERERPAVSRRLSRAFAAGFFAGLATLLEYHAFPVSLGLAIYALFTFYRPTRLATFTAGALVDAAGLMLFQWRAYHNPFMPGHRMTENPAFAQMMNKGFFTLGVPDPHIAALLSFDAGYGFFGTSPFMVLGLFAVPAVYLSRRGPPVFMKHLRVSTVAWTLMMLALWTAVSASFIWRGGWTVGPRYLGAAPPFFALGALVTLESFSGRSRLRRVVARGVAGGLALASIACIGLVGIEFNTLPEEITRPLVQFAWPFVRAGFVPYHAGNLFGFLGPGFWYAVAACMFGAALLAALVPLRERPLLWACRLFVMLAALWLGMRPAFSTPRPEEAGDLGLYTRQALSARWEPPSRDRITTLRRDVTHEPNDPCLYQRLADLERLVGNDGAAARDEAHVVNAQVHCRWHL